MDLKSEKIDTGTLTMLEYFVLENLLKFCDEQGIEPVVNSIIHMYSQIMQAVKSNPSLPISSKSSEQIHKCISRHDKLMSIFRNLCESQLTWNLCNEDMNPDLEV